jgi:methionine-rich copper-binding protein CopC
MMRTLRRAGTVGLAALVAMACSQQGAAHQPALQSPTPVNSATTAEDVMVVDQSRLDDIRKSYDLSEPLGEVSAVAACESGSASEECANAARQQLRQAAADREANLVVVTDSAVMQSFPPRMSMKGTLYRATPR